MYVTVDLKDFTPSLRKKIAEQTHCENALDVLAEDDSPYVRAAVALNPETKSHTINKLQNDSSKYVIQMLEARKAINQ